MLAIDNPKASNYNYQYYYNVYDVEWFLKNNLKTVPLELLIKSTYDWLAEGQQAKIVESIKLIIKADTDKHECVVDIGKRYYYNIAKSTFNDVFRKYIDTKKLLQNLVNYFNEIKYRGLTGWELIT